MKLVRFVLLLLFCRISSGQNATLETQASEACKDFDRLGFLNETAEQREADSKTLARFGVDVELLAKALEDKDYKKIVTNVVVGLVLLCILVLVCLVMIPYFICFCCCCDSASGGTTGKARFYAACSTFFALAVIGVCAANLVFAVRLSWATGDADCLLKALHRDVINGQTVGDSSFIGLSTLGATLESLKSATNQLTAADGDLANLESSQAGDQFKSAESALPGVASSLGSTETADGVGGRAKPFSAGNLTDTVNTGIGQEFAAARSMAEGLASAASEARKISNPATSQDAQTALENIREAVVSLSQSISDALGQGGDFADVARTSAKISTIVAICIGAGVIVLCLLAVGFIWMSSKGRCVSARLLGKALLIILSILAFLVAAAALAFYVAAVVVGTACPAMRTIADAPDANALFTTWGLTIGPVAQVLQSCVVASASGNIAEALGQDPASTTSEFDKLETLLDGFSKAAQVSQELKPESADSLAVNLTITYWEAGAKGFIPDQAPVPSALQQLNSAISCASLSFQLNSANCTSAQTGCSGLFETDTFSAPSCSPANTQSLFDNLKSYQTDEETFVTSLQDALKSNSDSPNEKYRSGFNTLVSQKPSIENVISILSNTLASIKRLEKSFSEQSNCLLLRQELLILEGGVCNSMGKKVGIVFILSIALALCLLILMFGICCSIRCQPSGEREPVTVYATDDPSSSDMPLNPAEKTPLKS